MATDRAGTTAGSRAVEKTAEFWRRYWAGESPKNIGRRFGIAQRTAQERIRDAGGITPTLPCRAARHLTPEDREEISRPGGRGVDAQHR